MENTFLTVFNMSLTASYIFLVVLLVRLLLKRAPRRYSYYLWGVMLFRLVCPFSFESVLSLLPSARPVVPADIVYQVQPQIHTGIRVLDNAVNASLPAATPAVSMNPMQVVLVIAAVIWVVGVAGMLLYAVISIWMLKCRILGASPLGDNLYELEGLETPFVFGIFRPKTYLPAGLTEEEQRYVLLHEEAHLRRGDHLIKPLAFLVLCVHWFNPCCWAAFFLMGNDMELSCDEYVLEKLDGEGRKVYASCLLSFATGRRILNGSPLAFGEGGAAQRIKSALKYREPAVWVVGFAITALVLAGFGLMGNPQSPRPTLAWAQNLRAGEVEQIELLVDPGTEGRQYRLFTQEEIPEVVRLLNESDGRYAEQAEELEGETKTLYIRMKDGGQHTASNIGNTYLEIDGDYYRAAYGWLSGWKYEGNAVPPVGFARQASTAPLKALTGSVVYDPQAEELRFTIPQKLERGTRLSLHVSGRLLTEDGQGVSWHAFEEESESGNWEPGKTYRAQIGVDAMDTVELDAAILSETGDILSEETIQISGVGGTKADEPAANQLELPFSLSGTPVELLGGGTIEIQLVMTEGRIWNSNDPDFIYGGYFQDGDNYVGRFVLQSVRDGTVISQIPVELGNNEDLCFYGPVALQIADYNGDGNPDFALGSWLWSGGNSHNIYSVNKDGILSQIGWIERHDSRESSVLLEQPAEGEIAAKIWNQATGEEETVLYTWDGTSFLKEE